MSELKLLERNIEEIAKLTYETYSLNRSDSEPPWNNLPHDERHRWICATRATIAFYMELLDHAMDNRRIIQLDHKAIIEKAIEDRGLL